PTANGPTTTSTGVADTTRTTSTSALATALRSTAIAFAPSTRPDNSTLGSIRPSQCDDNTHVAIDESKPDAMTKLDVHPAIDASLPPPSKMSNTNHAKVGCFKNWRSAVPVGSDLFTRLCASRAAV